MSWYDYLLGGTSKKPGDFYTPMQHENQAMGAITGGLGTNHVAPQIGLQSDPFRGMQLQQIGQLQGIAGGTQKGAGELGIERQMQNAQAAQQAQARMSRGMNAGLASRDAANQTAALGISGAGMGQQAAMQDQMQAQNMLTGALGQGRGQDIQTQMANVDAQLRAMGMNDQARLGYLAQLTGMDANTLQAQMAQYSAAQQRPGMLGPLIGAGGQIGAAALM